MTSLLDKKSKLIREIYFKEYDEISLQDLDAEERQLFNSMERFHKLSHTSIEDWLPYLDDVGKKLGLRHEKHLLNTKLLLFLDKKRKSDALQDQITVLNVFDPVLPYVDDIYKSKLEGDRTEEFDTEMVTMGTSTSDGMFYEKHFLPCFIYEIYKSWLHCNELEEGANVFADLFTLGSGSRSLNLIPEVHGFCLQCAAQIGGKFADMNDSEIKNYNELIFKEQKKDIFMNRALLKVMHEDEETSEDNISCNPFESDNEDNSDKFKNNPFESNTSDEDLNLDGCEICFQSFPSEEFVTLHMKIFHSSNKLVKPVFVEEGEEMMKTFIQDEPSESKQKVSNPKPSGSKQKGSDKPKTSKYGLRSHFNM